jgi:O-antigen/teichoic acid export membrane protein
MMIIALSTPLLGTLFPTEGILNALFTTGAKLKFPYAPTFLAVSSIVNLFVLFGSLSLPAFQTGIGKTRQVMKQSLLSLVISVPFAYALIRYLGTFGGEMSEVYAVIGGIAAVMVSTIPGMVWGLIWAWKNYKVKADFKNSGKIFTAALFAAIVTYVFSIVVTAPHVILLFSGAIIFLIVYFITAPLIGAVNHVDIDNLKIMSSGLGPISKIIAIPLMFMQKICKKPKNKTTTSDTPYTNIV